MSTEKDSMPIRDKYLLTCREAAIYFNIGLKNMRSLARDRSLKISVKLRGRTLGLPHPVSIFTPSLIQCPFAP